MCITSETFDDGWSISYLIDFTVFFLRYHTTLIRGENEMEKIKQKIFLKKHNRCDDVMTFRNNK
jgi:hypothetical protein